MSEGATKPDFSGFRETSIVLNEKARGKDLIEVIGHAQDRMKTRGVSQQDVLNTLRGNTKNISQSQPGRIRLRWQKTPKIFIDVVFEELKDRIRVITVIKTTRSLIGKHRK